MARGGKRPGAGRKPKPRHPTPDEVQSAADRAEGIGSYDEESAPAGQRGRGRPSTFRAEYVAQGEKLCHLGATDAEMAAFFDVAMSTLYRWKLEHPEFSEALKRGKALADDMVEQRLFQRAVGYSHDAVKILQYEGQPVVVDFIEHYPPDTAAAFIWLKNRRPEKWRDKPLGEGGTPADLARDIEQARAAMANVEGRET